MYDLDSEVNVSSIIYFFKICWFKINNWLLVFYDNFDLYMTIQKRIQIFG